MRIRERDVGPGEPCYLIAEAGVNHNGSLDLSLRLVGAAASAGADAVKFQTFRADRLATPDAPKAAYQAAEAPNESHHEMLARLELSEEDHRVLSGECARLGIDFLSSPFDEQSADFLAGLGVPALKVPSGEVVNLPYLRHVAALGLPVVLSTGMATLDEVAAALEAMRDATDAESICDLEVVLLHCVTAYPAPPEEANLRAMATMADEFGLPVGFSDHTLGIEVALAAVALGAVCVEKHFTLDRTMPGPDHAASVEPDELAALVTGVRKVEVALGDGVKAPRDVEVPIAAVARKSLTAARDLAAGDVLAAADISARRPGTGIPPSHVDELVGRRLARPVAGGSVLTWDDVEGGVS